MQEEQANVWVARMARQALSAAACFWPDVLRHKLRPPPPLFSECVWPLLTHASLVQEIERLQDRVIELSKRQRQSDVNTLEAITNGVSGSMQSGNLDDTLTMEYSNKLKLKEEQIEVLVAEVMSLRASQHRSDSDAVKQLETARGRNAAMEQELEGRRRENETLKLQYDQQQMLQQQLHDPELAAATNDELQTFDQTSKMIDMEVLIARLKATVADKTRQVRTSEARRTESASDQTRCPFTALLSRHSLLPPPLLLPHPLLLLRLRTPFARLRRPRSEKRWRLRTTRRWPRKSGTRPTPTGRASSGRCRSNSSTRRRSTRG